jgi:hypothetical protein
MLDKSSHLINLGVSGSDEKFAFKIFVILMKTILEGRTVSKNLIYTVPYLDSVEKV